LNPPPPTPRLETWNTLPHPPMGRRVRIKPPISRVIDRSLPPSSGQQVLLLRPGALTRPDSTSGSPPPPPAGGDRFFIFFSFLNVPPLSLHPRTKRHLGLCPLRPKMGSENTSKFGFHVGELNDERSPAPARWTGFSCTYTGRKVQKKKRKKSMSPGPSSVMPERIARVNSGVGAIGGFLFVFFCPPVS